MENLQMLVSTLEDQKSIKKDYIVNPKESLFFHEGKLVIVKEKEEMTFTPTNVFHQQISSSLDIPKAYYDRMLSEGGHLIDNNVNHWLNRLEKNKMIRTFKQTDSGIARAFLSDKYNVIDNYDVLFEALEAIRATGLNIEIRQAELSETRMFVTITCPDIAVEAKEMLQRYSKTSKVGTTIISGFKIQNSEIGKGKFLIAPRGVVLACNNGLVVEKDALSRVHLGASLDELGMHENNAIVKRNLALIKEQVKHAVKVFLSKNYLEKLVKNFTEAGEKEIEAPIANVIEVMSKEYDISTERKANILNYFIKGGDTRRIGLVNAITEECQTLENIDMKHDSELIPMNLLNNFDKFEVAARKAKFSIN